MHVKESSDAISGTGARLFRKRKAAPVGVAFVIAIVATLMLPFSTGLASADLADGNVALTVLSPTPGQVITGPTLSLHVRASGYRIDARYAGTPVAVDVGHYHEILDGKLVDTAPYKDGNRDTIPMVGVSVGAHTLTIVPARNDHSEIGSAAVNIPLTYAGPYLPEPAGYVGTGTPTIAITGPAAGSTVSGSDFSMTADVTNFVLCGECFGKDLVAGEGHWHIFVDQPMMSNMLSMAGGTSQTVSLKGVTPGWHSFWAVLVDNHHMPFMDPATGMFAPGTATSVSLFVRSGRDGHATSSGEHHTGREDGDH